MVATNGHTNGHTAPRYEMNEHALMLAVATEELDRVLHRGLEPSPDMLVSCGIYAEPVREVQVAYQSQLGSAQILQMAGYHQDGTPHEMALGQARHTWAMLAHFAARHQPHLAPLLNAIRMKQPVFDASGTACCSLHPTQRLRVSRDGGSWYCGKKIGEGQFCEFRWSGELPASSGSTPEASHPLHAPAALPQPDGSIPSSGRRLHHGDDLDQLSDPKYVIDQLLPCNDLVTLYGESGAGKSIMLLDIALTVAQHAPVVYVMAEALNSYKQRSRAWMQHHKLQRGQFHYFDAPIDLMSDADIEAVCAEMRATLPSVPALVVIDTLAPCFGDGDENSTRDMNVVCRHAHRMRTAFGCTVLICHHTGRSGGHERGSIVLRGNCAVMLELKNDDGLISLRCDKNRHGHDFETRYFRFVEVASTDSVVPIPASRVMRNTGKLSERQLQVLHALTLRTLEDGATFSDLLDATDLARSTMHGVLSALVERDFIEREEQTKNRAVYRLTSRGMNAIQQHDRQQETAQQPSGGGKRTTLNWSISTPAAFAASFDASSDDELHQDAVVRSSSIVVRTSSEPSVHVRSGVPPSIEGEPRTEQQNKEGTDEDQVAEAEKVDVQVCLEPVRLLFVSEEVSSVHIRDDDKQPNNALKENAFAAEGQNSAPVPFDEGENGTEHAPNDSGGTVIRHTAPMNAIIASAYTEREQVVAQAVRRVLAEGDVRQARRYLDQGQRNGHIRNGQLIRALDREIDAAAAEQCSDATNGCPPTDGEPPC